MYDITAPASLHDTLPYFLNMIDMEADNREDTGQVPPVKILAGNKCDLKEERRVSSREGLEWARARGCGFMETSARECVNVEETFARACSFSSFRLLSFPSSSSSFFSIPASVVDE